MASLPRNVLVIPSFLCPFPWLDLLYFSNIYPYIYVVDDKSLDKVWALVAVSDPMQHKLVLGKTAFTWESVPTGHKTTMGK